MQTLRRSQRNADTSWQWTRKHFPRLLWAWPATDSIFLFLLNPIRAKELRYTHNSKADSMMAPLCSLQGPAQGPWLPEERPPQHGWRQGWRGLWLPQNHTEPTWRTPLPLSWDPSMNKPPEGPLVTPPSPKHTHPWSKPKWVFSPVTIRFWPLSTQTHSGLPAVWGKPWANPESWSFLTSWTAVSFGSS